MKRATTYHRPRNSWLNELKKLHARGHSDARLAEELSDLFSPRHWTKRQVQHWRKGLGLKANPHRWPEFRSLAEAREIAERVYAARQGWAHILPGYNHERQMHVHGWHLAPLEVDVLTALDDLGEATLSQIRASLGKSLISRGQHVVALLVRRGLVRVVGRDASEHRVRRFALAEGLTIRLRTLRADGTEDFARFLRGLDEPA